MTAQEIVAKCGNVGVAKILNVSRNQNPAYLKRQSEYFAVGKI